MATVPVERTSSPFERGLSRIQGISSLPASPKKSTMSALKSTDFASKIRALEEQGKQLMAMCQAVNNDDVAWMANLKVDQSGERTDELAAPRLPVRAASLSSLTDIQKDQKALTDFRKQLECELKDTGRVQSELLSDQVTGLDENRTLDPDLAAIIGKPLDFMTQWKLEKELKESQEESKTLRKRLKEITDISDDQRKQFRTAIEELKTKLQDAISSRDSIMELRQQETAGQESLISKLQMTVQQLQEANRVQDQKLAETTANMSMQHQSMYVTETSIKQIKKLLSDVEKKKERVFFDTEPVENQSSTMLVHTVERCMQDLEAESEMRLNKVRQLECEVERLQKSSDEERQTLMREHQEKLLVVSEEHDKQLNAAAERSMNARKQAASLQEQLDLLQDQKNQELRMKTDQMIELQTKLKMVQDHYELDKNLWGERRQAFEHSLDEAQRELTSAHAHRDEIHKEKTDLQSRIADLDLAVDKLNLELDSEKDQTKRLFIREDEMKQRISQLEQTLEMKNIEVCKLDAQLGAYKQESSLNLQVKIANVEKTEQEKATERAQQLLQEISIVSEKYNKCHLDLELSKNEVSNMKHKIVEFTDKLDEARLQLETVMADKENLKGLLNDRVGDCERLTKERDYYFNLLDERNGENTQLKEERTKMSLELMEKERSLDGLQRQMENMTHAVQVNTKQQDTLKDEKIKLEQLMVERTAELEETRVARESYSRKLKHREKRLKEMDGEKVVLAEELRTQSQQVQKLQQEKETLFGELKESRYEVAYLTDERDTLKKTVEGKAGDKEKQIQRLLAKVRTMEHSLQLARKALKKKQTSDGKVIKVAGKMQKEVTAKRGEVDALQSKVYWLEECLESSNKEKRILEEENEKLASLIQQTTMQNEKLSSELEAYIHKSQDYRDKIGEMETSLEKAAIKSATYQANLEKLEQEMARMKLKHKLEVKETERQRVPSPKPAVTFSVPPSSSTATAARVTSPAVGASTYQHTAVRSSNYSHAAQGSTYPPTAQGTTTYPYTGQSSYPSYPAGSSAYPPLPQPSHMSYPPHPGYHTVTGPQHPPPGRQSETQKPLDPAQAVTTANEVSHELKNLLSDMRQLIHSSQTLAGNQEKTNFSSEGPTNTPTPLPTNPWPTSSNPSPTPKEQPYQDLFTSPTKLSVSSKMNGCYSPVSKLLSPHVDPQLDDSIEYVDTIREKPPSQKPPSRPSSTTPVTAAMTTDAQVLWKRLEDKIESLTKMGGQLQQDNKATAALIRDQDKKLKKIRQSERILQKK